jgi:hypothetical protein
VIFHKRRNLYISTSPLTKVLGLHTTKSSLHQSKTKNYKRRPSLCHLGLTICS